MSKLVLSNRIPRDYNPATFQEIVRLIEEQSNQHAEGKLRARHGAMTAAPTSGNWERGDLVDNSSPSVVTSDVADYVVIGWVCTVSGTPGTWKERRVLVEDISMVREPTLGTPVATTSGTAFDFTGIPSWVKKVSVLANKISLSGTDDILVQLGDSGGFETTGYTNDSGRFTSAGQAVGGVTSGFNITRSAASSAWHGAMVLTLLNSSTNLWVATIGGTVMNSEVVVGGGSKALSDVLTQVRITRTGTDTFDDGSLNIMYE